MSPRETVDSELKDRALQVLQDVTLDHFTANPTAIGPFGASTLSWKVDGPIGFRVRINGVEVDNSGERTVQPQSTQTYRLYAYLSLFSQFLGSVTVNVDLGQCTSRESSLIDELLKGALKSNIEASNDVYFRLIPTRDETGATHYVRSQPIVTIEPGRIRFKLYLAGRVDNFPDPSIDIDASFGLDVVNDYVVFFRRKLVPVDETIHIDISEPWWAWLIPGAPIGLPIAMSAAEEKVRKTMQESIRDFVDQGIDAFFASLKIPPGMEKHSVRIYDSDNVGTVEITYCGLATRE